MHDALLDLLADPIAKTPLTLLDARRDAGGEIVEGALGSGADRRYAITGYIPRFVATSVRGAGAPGVSDASQRQVERSFAYKWQQRHTYSSPDMIERSRQWLVARYGFASADEMCGYMSAKPRVLDAGCGGGFSASLWLTAEWNRSTAGSMLVGADISEAVDVARDRLSDRSNTHFVQADLLQLPFKPDSFDAIIAEGVLHHTPSTECAFHALVPLLRRGGELMAYVYRRKSPVREFTDDWIRDAVSPLEPEQAWEALRPLTALGRSLASLHADVDVTDDVPLLGIKAGRYDVQRLMYWHFAKMFWNDAYSFEENLHVNFDWYHPRYAHRHTESDIRSWCDSARVSITHFDAQESGYTVRAVKA